MSRKKSGFRSRGEYIWIDGVRISPYDCPDCLKYDEFDCDLCSFFAPETCKLLRDSVSIQETKTMLDIFQERQAAQLKRQQELIHAISSELQTYGRPLHYTVLARMVADRHSKLQVTEFGVLRIMSFHPDVFEKVADGVYKCKKARKRRR